MKSLFTVLTCLFFMCYSYSQGKQEVIRNSGSNLINEDVNPQDFDLRLSEHKAIAKSTDVWIRPERSLHFEKPDKLRQLRVTRDPKTNTVIAIKGTVPNLKNIQSSEERGLNYIKEVKSVLQIQNPGEEFELSTSETDQNGRIHNRYQQKYKGIKILDSEILTHEQNGNVYFLNGRAQPTPYSINLVASISANAAKEIVIKDLNNFRIIPKRLHRFLDGEQIKIEQVINYIEEKATLAWHIDIFSNIAERWEYTIDAQSGQIIDKHETVCRFNHENEFDGKTSGQAVDLLNQTRNINIYECGNAYFLADASRTMFHGNESDCTNDDLLINGVIMTYDGQGNSPASPFGFNYNYSIAQSANGWNDPRAISAHYNGGRAYEYFKKFGRESINGDRGNIESFYNVTDDDGTEMDNAFWTGAAIFYGNGKEAFVRPLAAGLDVAGHEMSHGVIQTTANLRYQGESGALNESFADVFGTLIENETYQIGEDVVNPQIYRTGALRNMADPNNGGTRLGDPGYQPASVSEQYLGKEDNGGVHINSGIPNYVFFLISSNEAVGVAATEQIYYKVLTQYLTPRSQFVDLRAAVVQVAREDFGQQAADVAVAAFNEVGIGTGGSVGAPTPAPELEENPGTDFILSSSLGFDIINNSTNSGNNSGINFQEDHISKPSITDDGRIMVFVNTSKQIEVVEINWSTGSVTSNYLLSEQSIFRNAIISKDGTKVAAITGDLSREDFDNKIYVFDFSTGQSRTQAYDLYNPTFTEGISTGEVLYADAMEFDHSGENIVYDAFNQLTGTGTLGQVEDLSYWDIGIIQVWSNAQADFVPADNNNIYKVFSGLPENVSVGNPTFSKNSQDIIAFDFREIDVNSLDTTFQVLGANLNTGDIGVMFDNNTWGYPNYSIDDTEMIFSVLNNGTENIIGRRNVNSDKISASGDATILIRDAFWAVWFGTGQRDLVSSSDDQVISESLTIYPNPANDLLSIEVPDDLNRTALISIFSLAGEQVISGIIEDDKTVNLNIGQLSSGMYVLKLRGEDKIYTQKFMVLE